jgi:squalene-hopene/tetraprenyl-beta-curcumene cyclase
MDYDGAFSRVCMGNESLSYTSQSFGPAWTPSLLSSRIDKSLDLAASALLDMQSAEGFWCGELLADTTLESDYILLQLWLHQPEGGEWRPAAWPRIQKAARSILKRQLSNGGFNIYSDGPAEVSATVKAYGALKLAGVDPKSGPMRKARECILSLGGVQAANSYVKINLSLFGLYPRKHVPVVPPEIIMLPGNALYEMSSWTRAILVPLSIVQARAKQRRAPDGFTLEEIFRPGVSLALPKRTGLSKVFNHLDRAFKVWEKRGPGRVRAAAIRASEQWMLDRTRYTDGLGAIYPAMMYCIMALDALGYPSDHPDLLEATRHFESLMVEKEDDLYFQPCFSPVWDTALAAFALGEMGCADTVRMGRAADWLIGKEVRRRGDWSVKRPKLEPSGWAFEFANEFYPDIDDTAQVLLALMHATGSRPERQRACEKRALNWLLNMQSCDGGWAAFDVDNNWGILNAVPFADHNAMLDPTCPDISGRVLESLLRRGIGADHPAVIKAKAYLLATQEQDGSWYGRWGANYVYGTFLALRGLAGLGAGDVEDRARKAAAWLRGVQNADGGWGESCDSYSAGHYVPAPSVPSQTAWGTLGLLAAGETSSPELLRGLSFLLERQESDGTWPEGVTNACGFPNVFYLTYGLYRNYFPLLALATARKILR